MNISFKLLMLFFFLASTRAYADDLKRCELLAKRDVAISKEISGIYAGINSVRDEQINNLNNNVAINNLLLLRTMNLNTMIYLGCEPPDISELINEYALDATACKLERRKDLLNTVSKNGKHPVDLSVCEPSRWSKLKGQKHIE
jgi:hypothetical protein